MTIENLNLFAAIAIVLTCVIGIALNFPAIRYQEPSRLQTLASFLMDALRGHGSPCATEDYSIRYITRSANGENQFYRFTISKAGSRYRAYIDSAPRLNVPLEQSGVRCEEGRYFIDAGMRSSALDAEMVAKDWANAQSSAMRIGPE